MTGRLKAVAVLTMGLLMLPAVVSAAVPADPLAGEQRTGDAVAVQVPLAAPSVEAAPVAPGTQTYAQREAAAKGLETFEGGGAGVYIGGSTIGIILVVVLLVVLL